MRIGPQYLPNFVTGAAKNLAEHVSESFVRVNQQDALRSLSLRQTCQSNPFPRQLIPRYEITGICGCGCATKSLHSLRGGV